MSAKRNESRRFIKGAMARMGGKKAKNKTCGTFSKFIFLSFIDFKLTWPGYCEAPASFIVNVKT